MTAKQLSPSPSHFYFLILPKFVAELYFSSDFDCLEKEILDYKKIIIPSENPMMRWSPV